MLYTLISKILTRLKCKQGTIAYEEVEKLIRNANLHRAKRRLQTKKQIVVIYLVRYHLIPVRLQSLRWKSALLAIDRYTTGFGAMSNSR